MGGVYFGLSRVVSKGEAALPKLLVPWLIERIRALQRVRGGLRLLDLDLALASHVGDPASHGRGELADVWHGDLPSPAPGGSAESASAAARPFDLVVSWLTLDGGKDPAPLLQWVRGVIARDGLFFVLLRNRRPWYSRLMRQSHSPVAGTRSGWNPGDFRTLLIRSGFRIGESRGYGFLPLPFRHEGAGARLARLAHNAADRIGQWIDRDAGTYFLLSCRPGA